MFFSFVIATWFGLLVPTASTSAPHETSDQYSLALYVTARGATANRDRLVVYATLVNIGQNVLGLLGELHEEDIAAFKPFPLSLRLGGSSGKGIRNMSEKGNMKAQSISNAFDSNTVTVLQPGDNIPVLHDRSRIYSLDAPIAYTTQITAGEIYASIVKDDNTTGYAIMRYEDGNGRITNFTPPFDQSRSRKLQPRFRECNPAQQDIVIAAARSASEQIDSANAFLADPSSARSDRFLYWFGDSADETHWSRVKQTFSAMRNQPLQIEYDCSCERIDVYAFIERDRPGVMQLCKLFWLPRITWICYTQAGGIIHELSHFDEIGGTKDFIYGGYRSWWLALSNPTLASKNADNYQFFATDSWFRRYFCI